MNNNHILLITKDALCKDYLPVYGNKYWSGKTPNMDELAKKGTLFLRHYTAAPSTVMSFRSMVTGMFAHEQPYAKYVPVEIEPKATDLFEMAKAKGYEGHLIWDSTWVKMVLRYGNCYGKDTQIHNLDEIKQGVGSYKHVKNLQNNEGKVKESIRKIVSEVDKIQKKTSKAFIWIHLPHVINGRTAYGSDIDAFDILIGELRHLFSDENIFISADHGNMNGYQGKFCYGFDVNTPAIEIPLISPRIDDLASCEQLTSNVDIKTLIFNRVITKRDFVFSDCAYYAQPHRKLAIVTHEFAYIFNKVNQTEEFYDLINDRYERCNLLLTTKYDPDRKNTAPVSDYYYSPYWNQIEEIIAPYRKLKESIWKKGTFKDELTSKYIHHLKYFAAKWVAKFNNCKNGILQ